jgi:hypothetical protein
MACGCSSPSNSAACDFGPRRSAAWDSGALRVAARNVRARRGSAVKTEGTGAFAWRAWLQTAEGAEPLSGSFGPFTKSIRALPSCYEFLVTFSPLPPSQAFPGFRGLPRSLKRSSPQIPSLPVPASPFSALRSPAASAARQSGGESGAMPGAA